MEFKNVIQQTLNIMLNNEIDAKFLVEMHAHITKTSLMISHRDQVRCYTIGQPLRSSMLQIYSW